MDPQKKSFQLCELASCTDLPVFEDVRQELFLPAKPPSSGDDDYESLETSSDCSYDSRYDGSEDSNSLNVLLHQVYILLRRNVACMCFAIAFKFLHAFIHALFEGMKTFISFWF